MLGYTDTLGLVLVLVLMSKYSMHRGTTDIEEDQGSLVSVLYTGECEWTVLHYRDWSYLSH